MLSAGPGAEPCRKWLILGNRTGGRRLCGKEPRRWTALSSLPTRLSLSRPRSEAFPTVSRALLEDLSAGAEGEAVLSVQLELAQ